MALWLSALIVAVPTYLYARKVRGVDRFETEPTRYLIAAFVWGAIPAALFALILQLLLAVPTTNVLGEERAGIVLSVVYAPITEEILKAVAVAVIYVWRRREFDGWIDGIVYGSTVGFGFAYVENLLYLSTAPAFGEWLAMFFLRVIVLGFMHGFWTSLVGIGFGLARHEPSAWRRVAYVSGGLALAIAAHAAHNATTVVAEIDPALAAGVGLLNYIVLIALMAGLRPVGARHERRLFRTYMVDEVPGTITADAYVALCGANAKSVSLPQPHQRFYQLSGELAQRKYDLIRFGDRSGEPDIDQLRGQLRAMSYGA